MNSLQIAVRVQRLVSMAACAALIDVELLLLEIREREYKRPFDLQEQMALRTGPERRGLHGLGRGYAAGPIFEAREV